jgi:hypothetical protein
MESEELILETLDSNGEEVMGTDEFIPDYSFLNKIRQMIVKLDEDDRNYGFCMES